MSEVLPRSFVLADLPRLAVYPSLVCNGFTPQANVSVLPVMNFAQITGIIQFKIPCVSNNSHGIFVRNFQIPYFKINTNERMSFR